MPPELPRYKRVEDLYFVEAGDEVYLTVVSRDIIVCINYQAFIVLRNLDGFSEIDDLATWLAEITGKTRREALTKIIKLCEDLHGEGVLTVIENPRDPRESGFKIDETCEFDVNKLPEVIKVWKDEELYNGLFVSTQSSDPCVVVTTPENGEGGEGGGDNGGEPPNVICEQTVNIPNGIFLNNHKLIVRTFNQKWKRAFEKYGISCQGQSKGK